MTATPITAAQVEEIIAAEQECERAVLRELGAAFEARDTLRVARAWEEARYVVHGSPWAVLLRTAIKTRNLPIPDELRDLIVEWWVLHKPVRRSVGRDQLFLDGLRILLPSYDGPAIRLYRGCSSLEHRRRVYGMSWTADRTVAECFADTDLARFRRGGSVLLATDAPAAAIIYAPCLDGWRSFDDQAEHEYLVDRRRLNEVEMLAGRPQKPLPFEL